MPEHVFTIAAIGAVIDSQTNRLTFYSVLERIGTSAMPVALPEFVLATLWKRENGEEGVGFVQRVRLIEPDGTQAAHLETPFDFSKPRQRVLNRIQMAVFNRVGEYRFEVCIKRSDETDYGQPKSQYPIQVELIEQRANSNQPLLDQATPPRPQG